MVRSLKWGRTRNSWVRREYTGDIIPCNSIPLSHTLENYKMPINDKVIFLTGGTGSFGKKFVQIALRDFNPSKVIVFSRDELKQHEMREELSDRRLRFFLGDIRDRERLQRAMKGVDIVIHAAALKQVPACEYNPMEAILTNVMGTRNVIEAALDTGVKKAVALSTDKAVNPVNLYGATKLCAEKLFIQSNSYSGDYGTRFCCVRYGNVVGSRGSVIPLFLNQRKNGRVTVTDKRMTRFWITLEQGVKFVIRCLGQMHGGEVFVPKIPSTNMINLTKAVVPECAIEEIGIRPGEKLHEVLISEDEARNALELDDMFIVQPVYPWWFEGNWGNGRPLKDGYKYDSETNEKSLSTDEIHDIVEEIA